MQIRSKEQWQQLFAEHATSGLSVRQFCRHKKLCSKYFSLRKKQLGWHKSASPFARAQIDAAIERYDDAPAVIKKNRPAQALLLRHGDCVVQFTQQPEPAFLAQLLRALS